jgi:hypothetical protein
MKLRDLSEQHPDPDEDINKIKAEDCNTENEMGSSKGRTRAFDVP